MKIAVLTSLYPSAVRPVEGIFAERRWIGMRARGHEPRIVHPLPWAPPAGPRPWREIRRMAARETRAGLAIERPRYLHLPRRSRRNARAFARAGLRALLAAGRPDVVVADYAWPAGWAALELAERAIPCVISGRGSDVLQVAGEAGLGAELGRALAAAGHWCGVSRDLVAAMDRIAGRPGQGVLVPNGVDLELFAPRDRDAARAALGLPAAGPLVVVVGHLIERKDPLLALEALAELARSRPELSAAFIGEGALRAALLERARELGFAERVLCVGRASPDELVRWYAACDALLLTSRREGRPNVVLEALACGRPVLATAAGGTGELLEGLPGMLADAREPAALAGGLARLLGERWPEERLRAHAARFSWDAGLDALERCLQGAVA